MSIRINRTVSIIVLTFVMALASAALAENQDFQFHWNPSPEVDQNGTPLNAAISYDVWVKRGIEAEVKIANVIGDTTYTLSAEPGVIHRIRVCAQDKNGTDSPMSEWSDPVYFDETRSETEIPESPELQGNYPNPFNPETRIVYGVPAGISADDRVSLEIYNVRGQRVRTFEVDTQPGVHEVAWDGTNNNGQPSPTGLYLTRFTVGNTVETSKMTMLK